MTVYAITGGAGFIGSHLARALLERGGTVRILDNLSTGRPGNLAGISNDIEVVVGDIRDEAVVANVMSGVDVVFHQAALPSVPRSIADPRTSLEVNVMGTLTVLDAARHAGVRRVVQASSSSVYGDTKVLPKETGMRPQPRSPYAVAKLTAETLGQSFYASFGLETVALRYFNVFGPLQDPESPYAAVIPKFIAALRDGRPVPVNGDGQQSRDFTYIDNVVDANLRAAAADGAAGMAFNIATGSAVSVNQMLATLGRIMNTVPDVQFMPERVGDVRDSLADCTPAQRVLGYHPLVGFEDGLRRTVESLVAPAPAH